MPADAEIDNRVEVIITYLEQCERPQLPMPAAPPRKIALLRAEDPPVHFYRYIYDLVGAPYNWVSRQRMSDGQIREIISDPEVYIYILYVGGVPAGFAELDARNKKSHELKFFGLSQDYTGLGLGRYFLTNIIDLSWGLGPSRLRLETCTLDHPAALPLYQKCGFRVFDRRKGVVELIQPGEKLPRD